MRRLLLFFTFAGIAFLSLPVHADTPPGFSLKWGSTGSGPGQFSRPIGIACDDAGNVYVADYRNDRIQKFTENGSYLDQWGPIGEPAGIEVANGFVYVASLSSHFVYKYTTGGILVDQWGGLGTATGEFDGPWGLAADLAGNIYVSDANNDRIQKFTSDGVYLSSWGGTGSATGQLDSPRGLCVDDSGFLYVADRTNHRVQKFTLDGTFVAAWGYCCSGEESFNGPVDVELDSRGDIYVADSGHARIQKFSNAGIFLTNWGYHGSGDGQFEGPSGLAIDAMDNVYVTEFANDRVQKFDPRIPPLPPPPPSCDDQPKIMVHVTAPTSKNTCNLGVPSSIDQAVVRASTATASGPFYFVYLVAIRGSLPEIAGLQIGITYENNASGAVSNGSGVDVFGWNLCATLQFPEAAWPGPGSGNTITWDKLNDCQTGEVSVAGYFYVGAYTADTFRVIPRPADELAAIADCGTPVLQFNLLPSDLGYVAFSPGAVRQGCNPCLADCAAENPIPVQNTTWGRIKSTFVD